MKKSQFADITLMQAVQDLLSFYQRELTETKAGSDALKWLRINSAEAVSQFSIGWCSGNAIKAASEEQKKIYKHTGLINRNGLEKLTNCIVFPVYNERDELVDLCGLRKYGSKGNNRRMLNWQYPMQGLIGISCLHVYPEIILTDNPFTALHVASYQFPNVIALRKVEGLKNHLSLLQRSGTRRVYVCSRQAVKTIASMLERCGIEAVAVRFPTRETIPPQKSFDIINQFKDKPRQEIKLVSQTASRLHFSINGITYRVDSTAMNGLGMRCQIKAENGKNNIIDKIDLASASSRQKFSRMAAGRLSIASCTPASSP